MRRKRFQRGSLKAQKRRGKLRWYAQWREEGLPKSKELGVCSEVSRITAEAMLQQILKPVNEGTEAREKTDHTFEAFIELVYLPVYEQKWKDSTNDTESNRIKFHLVRGLGEKPMRKITREELQKLLDATAKKCGRSVVDHLRFRLRSIFELAVSEGVADRNPATTLFTPPHQHLLPDIHDCVLDRGHGRPRPTGEKALKPPSECLIILSVYTIDKWASVVDLINSR